MPAMTRSAAALLTSLVLLSLAAHAELAVKITPDLEGLEVQHEGKAVRIQREQNQRNTITPVFQKTSRRCPPFCIQPMRMPNGVETIGELEMLDYLRRVAGGDKTLLIIDSRGPSWLKQGTIPGSINIHYKKLSRKATDELEIATMLEGGFGAKRSEELWDFRFAKTLVLFCNGPWCGQSPSNIRALTRLGYPPHKIKWYRGGMQSWETLGLTTVKRDGGK